MQLKKKGFLSVQTYVQGPGVILELPVYASALGSRCLTIIDTFFYRELSVSLREPFAQVGIGFEPVCFEGELTLDKAEAFAARAKHAHCDVIIGIGGGKTMDAAKVVAEANSAMLINAPTTASTDAPCSLLAIVYDEKIGNRRIIRCRRTPNVVLCDTALILKAPLRQFASGIGDAMSTYYEMQANRLAGSANFMGEDTFQTQVAGAIAVTCRDILLADAENACKCVRDGQLSDSFERVVEANILLSGVGFQSAGCAGAHSVSAGLAAAPGCAKLMHGEKVAFGVLCEMFMECSPRAEFDRVQALFRRIGLPVSLAQLGIDSKDRLVLEEIAARSMQDTFWAHEPFPVDEEKVIATLLGVDARAVVSE